MKTMMVRYKTTAAHANKNAALIGAVFSELRSRVPKNLHYTSYRLSDGETFVHMATVDTALDEPLTSLPSFKAFQSQLKGRCVEPPVFTELTLLETYGGLHEQG